MSDDHHRPRHDPLDALLEAAVDAIILSDAEGTIVRANPAAEALFGYSSEQLSGRNVELLMNRHDRDHHREYMARYVEGGPPAIIGQGREVTARHADGHLFPIHLSVGEISHDDSVRFVGIIRDLSAQKQIESQVRHMENQLAHADRLVVLGELTAGIAHEINQPLTAIAAFSDAAGRLLKSDIEGAEDELQAICERISQQARRAGDVVTRLRRLSQKRELTRSAQELAPLIDSVLLLFEHELGQSGIVLESAYDHGDRSVQVDEIQVQQVVANLVKNSIDALQGADQRNGIVRIATQATEDRVEIVVEDNGPGVPDTIQKHLFEPFFTTKDHGVGLGLSICRNIAVTHGGSLRYSVSELGGARFTLSLPLGYIG